MGGGPLALAGMAGAGKVFGVFGGPAEASTDATSGVNFIVGPDGVAIPTDASALQRGLSLLQDTSTNPAMSRKFVGADSSGLPIRVRIERAHPEDPNYSGPTDPIHIVDHLHLDRRANGMTGGWQSAWKIPFDWPW